MLADRTRLELARRADAAEIAGFSRREIEYGLRWRYTPVRVRALLADRSKNVVVARRGDTMVGFGIMTYGADSANLDLLGVRRRYRRLGVASELVRWLEKVAVTAGLGNVFVQARQSNRAAIALYQRLGYRVVERVPAYYQRREACVVLCKALRQPAGAMPDIQRLMSGPVNRGGRNRR